MPHYIISSSIPPPDYTHIKTCTTTQHLCRPQNISLPDAKINKSPDGHTRKQVSRALDGTTSTKTRIELDC
ncbi:unnamed protein product [Callosobruchus maculatus]|uniref:Uncharacterized protein n=1 Tax=Callosobruchus maculatus TaxID=64391 RepID=A0A653BJ94_CALMS|nr:unnamed protein product [Callosobruchus maculatus]